MGKTGVSAQDSMLQNRFSIEQLVFLSDAVFAIAVLVLDIRLPAGADAAGSRQLLLALASLWPQYSRFSSASG